MSRLSLILLFISSILLQVTLGEIICEDLPKEVCAFAVASSGKRCLLESFPSHDANVKYQCKTSSVTVDRVSGYIETDECMRACGIQRLSVGISSDALLDSESTFCSPLCYQNCPNIVDLYYNLAMGEGVYLPELCDRQKENPHRSISELMKSGPKKLSGAPAPAPAPGPAKAPTSSKARSPGSSPTYKSVHSPASSDDADVY